MCVMEYSKMTWKELHETMANNPVESLHYAEAKAERDYRVRRYILWIATVVILIAAVKIIFG
jgi:hypothetical protein